MSDNPYLARGRKIAMQWITTSVEDQAQMIAAAMAEAARDALAELELATQLNAALRQRINEALHFLASVSAEVSVAQAIRVLEEPP